MTIDTPNHKVTVKFSWIGFIVALMLIAITIECASYTHNFYYKRGYVDGYQARINYERGKDL